MGWDGMDGSLFLGLCSLYCVFVCVADGVDLIFERERERDNNNNFNY